ncbi:MAG: serine/threonine protein kinase [Nitrospirota bacterium]|nr:serine/threonine protein kinase [Nitrospirota bacterium]
MNRPESPDTLRLKAKEVPGPVKPDHAPSVAALPVGAFLHEYRILSVLGSGGFGITYLAQDFNLECKVAIKELFPPSLVTRVGDRTVLPRANAWRDPFENALKQFLAEARTLASFRHPNIVRVRRFFETNGTAYMVMEYEEGESLFRWVSGRGCPNRRTVLDVIMLVLNGLEAVHRAGFLHLDMKPSNIVVRPDGSPVLLDFGAARRLTTDKGKPITAILTPGYAPYEQYSPQGRLGPWNDLYSLGAVMYYMVTGKKPVEAPARIKTDPLPQATVAANVAEYGAGLLTAIDWALDPDDRRRPQSVAEFRAALLDDDPSLRAAQAEPFNPALTGSPGKHLARAIGGQAEGLVERVMRATAQLGEPCLTLEPETAEGVSLHTFQLETLSLGEKVPAPPPVPPRPVWPPPYQVDRSSGHASRQNRIP